MVAVELTGTREGNNTRTDSRAAPATLRLHLDVSILRQAQDRYVAENALASVTEATDNVAWPLSKNPVLTSSMNTWPSLAGCLPTGRLEDGRLRTTATRTAQLHLRPFWGRPNYSSASYDARAVMKNYCAFLHRNALRRARSNTG